MAQKRQLIAVAVDENEAITAHAGRAVYWLLYDVWSDASVRPVCSLLLDVHACLHEWHVSEQPDRHPLHQVDVLITASAGHGVISRLAERGVQVVTTAETEPECAVQHFLSATLAPGLEHDDGGCGH